MAICQKCGVNEAICSCPQWSPEAQRILRERAAAYPTTRNGIALHVMKLVAEGWLEADSREKACDGRPADDNAYVDRNLIVMRRGQLRQWIDALGRGRERAELFQPCALVFDEPKRTEIMLADAPVFWVPHGVGVDLAYDMESRELVGVRIYGDWLKREAA